MKQFREYFEIKCQNKSQLFDNQLKTYHMKKKKENQVHEVVVQILKIMKEKDLKQATMAKYAETSASQFSKILKGEVQLSLIQLSNIATELKMSLADIMLFGNKEYASDTNELKATLTLELKNNTKGKVLSAIFGDENVRILNE